MTIGGQGGQGQINVTPMIDVLLVLLIIFMVILPTKSVGLDSQVPQPADPSASPAPASTIVVYATGNGMAEVNRQQVTVAALGEQLMRFFFMRGRSQPSLSAASRIWNSRRSRR